MQSNYIIFKMSVSVFLVNSCVLDKTWEINMQVNSCMGNGQSSECIPFMCIFIDENT